MSEDSQRAHREATAQFSAALFLALRDAGVREVVVSPGSRSTPLALAAWETQGLEAIVHHDERSAGFFALGIAKQSGRAVALVCTSGSAAANYLPAVVEAHYARVPLIVLTADRPPELRECGAGQTIDQQHLYGTHARSFVELPVPGEGGSFAAVARSEALRAVEIAMGRPAGVVHLNVPFREPLEPPLSESRGEWLAEAAVRGSSLATPIVRRPRDLREGDVETLVANVLRSERGIVSCGPLSAGDEPGLGAALLRFSRASGWPMLADPLSQLRGAPAEAARREGLVVAETSELWLRDDAIGDALAPAAVLRIGAAPTSKAFRLWLEARPPESFTLVDPDDLWNDPSRLATERIPVDPVPLLERAAEVLEARGHRPGASYRDAVARAESSSREALAEEIANARVFGEPEVVAQLAEDLPGGAAFVVASSMAIRNVDAFFFGRRDVLRVLGNRGANGIDGTVSTALGAAAATDAPVVLLTGDLAFLHDLGGLSVAHRLGLRATIVVTNDDGGGIFSFLPIAARSETADRTARFDALFHTPHGIDFAGTAAMFGVEYERVARREEFAKALGGSLSSPGVQVIEVPVERDAKVARFRELASLSQRAVRQALEIRPA